LPLGLATYQGHIVLNIKPLRILALMAAVALLACSELNVQAAEVAYKYATVDDIKIFYREAGDPAKPTILLLHGFPSSSHQFRDLIPLLSDNFHVVAPDYPGMGYSEAPSADKFTPTFDNLTNIMTDFVQSVAGKHLIVYMTDFGGPVGMRMAVAHPDWVTGLVFQNANISLDGVDPARIKRNEQNATAISPARQAEAEAHVSMATALLLYKQGTRHPDALNPDAWTNDEHAILDPQSRRIMTQLQLDTPANIALFPVWQEYMRTRQPNSLVVWGRGDRFFLRAGADAIKKLVPAAEVHNYDTGHFALEEDHVDIAKQINRFFAPSIAQATVQVRVRGRIESIDGSVISVLSREGQHVQLAYDPGTRLSAVRPVDASVIKPGTYVGAAGTPVSGGVKALELMVFRDERRGTGEGHQEWDLVPGSSMTNATVTAVTSVGNGRDLALTYQGISINVMLPDNVPIVTFAPADASDLKVGAAVFAVTAPAAGGRLFATSLVIEKNGVKPPM
jgi:pimeloyl-ACP methyl ester carboxylesterase